MILPQVAFCDKEQSYKEFGKATSGQFPRATLKPVHCRHSTTYSFDCELHKLHISWIFPKLISLTEPAKITVSTSALLNLQLQNPCFIFNGSNLEEGVWYIDFFFFFFCILANFEVMKLSHLRKDNLYTGTSLPTKSQFYLCGTNEPNVNFYFQNAHIFNMC